MGPPTQFYQIRWLTDNLTAAVEEGLRLWIKREERRRAPAA
jgi:hypothetical protein